RARESQPTHPRARRRVPVLRSRGAAGGRERAHAAARARARPARGRPRRDDGADRQRGPGRLPGQRQRDLDVSRAQRTLGAAGAEARLHTWCDPLGELVVDSNAPSAPVHVAHPLVEALRRAGDLAVEAKQAWTPIAEFATAGLPAVNFGPGDPAYAHRRDEL